MQTVEEIWAGDLFGRQEEAERLISYLEHVSARPSIREDANGYVLAVDANYGEGKTFFLKRLASHIAQNHPVAFVDAWTDDLEDEPLVALASTLQRALQPYANRTPSMPEKLANLQQKTGEVAKIVAGGLLKRGAGVILTATAAEALGDVLAKPTETQKDIQKDAIKDGGKGIVDDAVSGFRDLATPSMDARIARFRRGQLAISEMKSALASIVGELNGTSYPPPIVIIVDELDRCRPTYAIKLLEEIKHLFDVRGVVFILGMHGKQLGHSVTVAYGASFDGKSYLSRFINRRYSLLSANLEPLLAKLFDTLNIPANQLRAPRLSIAGGNVHEVSPATLTGMYMRAYGLTARQAFTVVEVLETCLALVGSLPLYLPYLLPLAIAHVQGGDGLPKIVEEPRWVFTHGRGYGVEAENVGLEALARRFEAASKLTHRELSEAVNHDVVPYELNATGEMRFGGNIPQNHPSQISEYKRLVSMVSRFSGPDDI